MSANRADLCDADILAPIRLDEDGSTVASEHAWTGTGANCKSLGAGSTCNSWTSSSAGSGMRGFTDAKDSAWVSESAAGCDAQHHFYCFQVGPVGSIVIGP